MAKNNLFDKKLLPLLNKKPDEDDIFCIFSFGNDDESSLSIDEIPKQLDLAAVFFCLAGEAEVRIELKTYNIKKGDICVLFPFTIVQAVGKSSDFKGYGLSVYSEFITNIQIPSRTSIYLHIKDNPCISLTKEEQKSLLELCELVTQKALRKDLYTKEIVDKLLMIVSYEIAIVYSKRQPIAQKTRSRQDIIFQNFIISVTKNFKRHKDVNFYAQELYITPRYLSTIIKEQSGMSAAKWIHLTIIREAKNMLSSSDLTIQQIADELNFPNPSFFGQYFKKHTGVTPKTFRDKYSQ